ncbi:MAG: YkoF family thiamine/hydroxymethylpyrimidine-binding protein, partial [Nitratireductor sp.]
MFSGAQISIYPMTDDFVGVILGALSALDPYRDRLRLETDDISTLMVGPPELLFPAMRDLVVAASRGGVHCVLSAAVSRGCPGEPDDPACTPRDGLGGG